MQYLKDNVKQKIIKSALSEFKENGYQKSSMRDIAAKADIVSGNIYRYFENKETLFEITVGSTYELMKNIEKQVQTEFAENAINFAGCGNFKFIKDAISQSLGVFSECGTELLVLLDKSEGTKYAGCKEDLKRAVSGTLHNVCLAEFKKIGKKIEDDFILDVMASSFIDGVCLILRNDGDSSHQIELINSWFYVVFNDFYQRI